MTQNHHWVSSRNLVFLRQEGAPQCRFYSQNVEVIGSHQLAVLGTWRRAWMCGESDVYRGERQKSVEAFGAIAQFHVIAIRDQRGLGLDIGFVHRDQLA